jgi:hypothetical protein
MGSGVLEEDRYTDLLERRLSTPTPIARVTACSPRRSTTV